MSFFGIQMFMDLVLEGLLREHLMVAPLLVVVGITEQLVTMGAEDFEVSNHEQTKKRTQMAVMFYRYTALIVCYHSYGAL